MYTYSTAGVIENYSNTAAQETLVVILATGDEDGGKRATLAFTAATCAAAMDKRAIMFMVGDGAHWAYEGRTAGVQQNGFPPLEELMDCLIDMDGNIYVCSTCDEVCSVPSDDEASDFRRHPAIEPRGMSAVLSDMTEGRCITF
ncbi:MAG: DsrE family protein [Gammaproteobacteria bacterium]